MPMDSISMCPITLQYLNLSNNQANTLPTVIAANVDATSSTDEYACYIHQTLCSTPVTTLIQTLKYSRKLATIPSLTAHLINTHLPY